MKNKSSVQLVVTETKPLRIPVHFFRDEAWIGKDIWINNLPHLNSYWSMRLGLLVQCKRVEMLVRATG